MTGFTAMPGNYYVVCLLLVMTAWVFFTLAFTVFRPKTPGGKAAAASPEAVAAPPPAGAATDAPLLGGEQPVRDRRSLWGIVLQGLGYALMWMTFRAPFPSLSKFADPVPLIVAAAAVVLAWVAAWFAFWSQRTLGKEWSFTARLLEGHRLVTSGPYAIVRHPIYTSMLGLWFATALAVARPFGIVLGIVPMLIGTLLRVRIEDGLLRASFGGTFDEWKKRTPAMIPGLL